jgi:hypothetical protein
LRRDAFDDYAPAAVEADAHACAPTTLRKQTIPSGGKVTARA